MRMCHNEVLGKKMANVLENWIDLFIFDFFLERDYLYRSGADNPNLYGLDDSAGEYVHMFISRRSRLGV